MKWISRLGILASVLFGIYCSYWFGFAVCEQYVVMMCQGYNTVVIEDTIIKCVKVDVY